MVKSVDFDELKKILIKIMNQMIIKDGSINLNASEKDWTRFFKILYKEPEYRHYIEPMTLFMAISELAFHMKEMYFQNLGKNAEEIINKIKTTFSKDRPKINFISPVKGLDVKRKYTIGNISIFRANKKNMLKFLKPNNIYYNSFETKKEKIIEKFENKICIEFPIADIPKLYPFHSLTVYKTTINQLEKYFGILELFSYLCSKTLPSILVGGHEEYRTYWSTEDHQEKRFDMHHLNHNLTSNNLVINKELLDNFRKLKIDKFFDICRRNSNDLNEIEKRISKSLWYYHDASRDNNVLSRFVKLTSIFETLLTKSEERENISRLLRERLFFILESKPKISQELSKADFNKIYDIRSRIVHGDEESIEWYNFDEYLRKLELFVSILIYDVTLSKYKTLNGLFIDILKEKDRTNLPN